MNNRFIEPVLTELSEPTNFFFEQTPELDAATGVIGHLRIDFGRNGKQFLHTWKQRGKAELNTPIFQEDLRQVMDMLRKDVLKDLKSMRQFCRENGGKIPGGQVQNYGYTITSDVYEYYLRCNPVNRGYQAYLTYFDLQEQRIDGNYQPLVGQIWFYGGEHLQYRTAEEYLECIREELPYRATNGFWFQTISREPAVRKAVDDIVLDLYGEGNPCWEEDYELNPSEEMQMGGM